jgi:hypothetical protein
MGTFRYLDSSPEVIRLVVMFYMKCVHFAEKNVEDPLAERGSDARHEKIWDPKCVVTDGLCSYSSRDEQD